MKGRKDEKEERKKGRKEQEQEQEDTGSKEKKGKKEGREEKGREGKGREGKGRKLTICPPVHLSICLAIELTQAIHSSSYRATISSFRSSLSSNLAS